MRLAQHVARITKPGETDTAAELTQRTSPLAILARNYAEVSRRARFELHVSVSPKKWFPVQLLGLSRASGHLIISAPRTPDRSLIAIRRGTNLDCSWANSAYVFHFRATITNLAFEPTPLVYLGQLQAVRRATVRSEPRALTALSAAVHVPNSRPALIVDLSRHGAGIGTAGEIGVPAGAALKLTFRLPILGRDHDLNVPCTLANDQGHTDAQNPLIRFYGLKFAELDEHYQLILHAYVQERLALESDLLSQLLLHDAGPVESTQDLPQVRT